MTRFNRDGNVDDNTKSLALGVLGKFLQCTSPGVSVKKNFLFLSFCCYCCYRCLISYTSPVFYSCLLIDLILPSIKTFCCRFFFFFHAAFNTPACSLQPMSCCNLVNDCNFYCLFFVYSSPIVALHHIPRRPSKQKVRVVVKRFVLAKQLLNFSSSSERNTFPG